MVFEIQLIISVCVSYRKFIHNQHNLIIKFCLISALNFFRTKYKFKLGHFLVILVQNQAPAYQDILLAKT